MFITKNGTAEQMEKDRAYTLQQGDSFSLLLDEYPLILSKILGGSDQVL